jgi:threonine dehydrogenase-like Zn-dependent dehydrogenase
MRAVTVQPGVTNSVKLEEISDPAPSAGTLLVRALALGVCGTDRDIVSGGYGWAPPGRERLVLGHESLGAVEEAPSGSGFSKGDLVVGIVRRPDPLPCPACAGGEWDMCQNGEYTERGIKQRDGYGCERYRLEPDFAVKIDPALGQLGVLLEPASVVAKAWDHVERIGARTRSWKPRSVLVTGAGPIGLLAALLGKQRGLDVHVVDRNTSGPKPGLVRDLGAAFHGALGDLEADVVIECTGAPSLVREIMTRMGPSGIACLAGVSPGMHKLEFDFAGFGNRMVLQNGTVFGTVNANRMHYRRAAEALAKADKTWLSRLISRRVPLDRWQEILERREGDIKVVLDFTMQS